MCGYGHEQGMNSTLHRDTLLHTRFCIHASVHTLLYTLLYTRFCIHASVHTCVTSALSPRTNSASVAKNTTPARVKRGSNLNGAISILANVFSSWKSVLPKTCRREKHVKCVMRAMGWCVGVSYGVRCTVCECVSYGVRCTVYCVRC